MADGTAMSCREVVEVITDYLEGALTPERTAIFECVSGITSVGLNAVALVKPRCR